MPSFKDQKGYSGYSHKGSWKETVTLGAWTGRPVHPSTLLLGLSAWEVCVLWKKKSQSSAHRPPWRQFVTGRCKACSEGTLHLSIHVLSTEQTMANDMVPAQWERMLNGRQACHPKTISSTSNFISQLQGQKQRLESSAFYRTLYISKEF